MFVLGICGSPKKENSTTLFGLKKTMEVISGEGIDTEIIPLSQHPFSGCIDCGYCKTTREPDCFLDDEYTRSIIPLLKEHTPSGFVFASPVYFGGMSSQLKAFFDRSVIFRRHGFLWENCVAGALSVGRSRHGGQEITEMEILRSALIQGMIAVPDASPTSHFGANLWSGLPQGIEADEAGLATAVNLGYKVAEIVKKLHSASEQ
jgi:multimeric flavodoxin WrbA